MTRKRRQQPILGLSRLSIPYELLSDAKLGDEITVSFDIFLHQVVHTAIRMYNGDWAWMDYRLTFEHNGKRYVQDKGCPCVDCCFFGSDALNRPECMHPYKNNPSGKGVCNGLVYKEESK